MIMVIVFHESAGDCLESKFALEYAANIFAAYPIKCGLTLKSHGEQFS